MALLNEANQETGAVSTYQQRGRPREPLFPDGDWGHVQSVKYAQSHKHAVAGYALGLRHLIVA